MELFVAHTVHTRKNAGTQRGEENDAVTAAQLKLLTTDMQCKVIDECLQLHGGYGYMTEYPVARAYTDARVQKIYAGTNEIMKLIIGRALV